MPCTSLCAGALLIAFVPAAASRDAASVSPDAAMGFEVDGAWLAEADLLAGDIGPTELRCGSAEAVRRLSAGLTLSTRYVKAGRFFLSYYAQGPMVQLFRDELDALVFIRPDRDEHFRSQLEPGDMPVGAHRSPRKDYATLRRSLAELVTLVADPGGDRWRLAVTSHFRPPAPSARRPAP